MDALPVADLYLLEGVPVNCEFYQTPEHHPLKGQPVIPVKKHGFVVATPEVWDEPWNSPISYYEVSLDYRSQPLCTHPACLGTTDIIEGFEDLNVSASRAYMSSFLGCWEVIPTPNLLKRFADSLQAAGLRGVDTLPAPYDKRWTKFDEPLCVLVDDSHRIRVRRQIGDGIPNVCPFCGHGPIVCPNCGSIDSKCHVCHEWIFNFIHSKEALSSSRHSLRLDTEVVFPKTQIRNRVAGAIDWSKLDPQRDLFGSIFRREAARTAFGLMEGIVHVLPEQVFYPNGLVGLTQETAVDPFSVPPIINYYLGR